LTIRRKKTARLSLKMMVVRMYRPKMQTTNCECD
jgi:hypothetical protein